MNSNIDISNAELTILKVLWESSPRLSADIVIDVQKTHDWHEKTIKTLLSRLVKKGAVDFEKSGRAYCYSPRVNQQDYQKRVSSTLVDRLFSGRLSGLVSGFAQQRDLSRDDVESLKRIIAEWEEQQEQNND
ncbi:BlaI/MecI/CopY family transcriptional regulator [Idiomarina ramblicola]|uniref:Transcriptional regulator n=1 Tax=Idiomarina ramblicola TaxID=263724 RepID=A0A432YUH5_9GAMM|nr:BlaI/MecI/CopY family transcriptional regulator [Idiomarina ramblicola]RUO66978.1 transcriptional regulator [Idiomarina ramblicola]